MLGLKWPVILITFATSVLVLVMALKQYLPSVTPLRGCLTAKMNNYWLCEQSDNYVPLRDISKVVVDAIVLSEDGSFFDHQGFDWYEIQKSLQKNMTAMKYARGASTITQQLAKNVFLSPEKSMLRKLREAYLTVELEKQFSKSIILEKYLNVIEFGPNIYGVKAGAKYYFAKAPSEVNLVDAAFLAFVLPNPKEYQKSFEKKDLTEFARKRLQQIIRTMFRFGRISGEDRDAAAEYLGVVGWIDEKSEETNEQINDQLNTLEEALQVPVDEPEQLPEQVPEPFEVEEEHSD